MFQCVYTGVASDISSSPLVVSYIPCNVWVLTLGAVILIKDRSIGNQSSLIIHRSPYEIGVVYSGVVDFQTNLEVFLVVFPAWWCCFIAADESGDESIRRSLSSYVGEVREAQQVR